MDHYSVHIHEKHLDDGACRPDTDAAQTNAFIAKVAKLAIVCLSSSVLCGINLMAFGISAKYLQTYAAWTLYAEVFLVCLTGFLIIWAIRQENDVSNSLVNSFVLVQGLYSGIIISRDNSYGLLSGAMVLMLLLVGSVLAMHKYGTDLDKLCGYINESTESIVVVLWLPFMLAHIGEYIKHLVLAVAVFYLSCNTMCMVLKKHKRDQHLKAGIDFYLHAVVKFVILQGILYAF
ncbi:hypothetical protein LPJ59_004105 [Coemansia sp. RSA 2399]|nr:hypothetical protein LPJ59_004105 [Coemansia sp. RSA 2399]